MCYLSEGGGIWMAVGWVFMVLFWAGIVGLAVWGVTRFARHSHHENGAFAIARERYARGEISKEEFDQIKRDLS